MKKLFLVLFFVLVSINVIKADENRYVEISVSDTVYLNAVSYKYIISFGESVSLFGMKFSDDEVDSTKMPDINSIKAILDKENYTYSIDTYKDYSITKTKGFPEISLVLKTENDLKKIYNLLKDQIGLNCKIKDVVFEPVSKYYESSYTKLFNKAQEQAAIIAKLSGSKIDRLISSTDAMQDSDVYMNMYKQMMKEMPMFGFGDQDVSKRKEILKMVFRFGIK